MDPVVKNLAALVTQSNGKMINVNLNCKIASNSGVFHVYIHTKHLFLGGETKTL